jgi:hypothetical protein
MSAFRKWQGAKKISSKDSYVLVDESGASGKVSIVVDGTESVVIDSTGITSGGMVLSNIEDVAGGAKTTGDHEATTSLTVGGTVITDGVLTDDGGFSIITTGDLLSLGDGTAVPATIGFSGDDLVIKNNDASGHIVLEGTPGEGEDQRILFLGDPDSAVSLYFANNVTFKTKGGGVTVTGDIDSTTSQSGTYDAGTDFTVGGTVISDASISDDGTLIINGATEVQIHDNGHQVFGTNSNGIFVGRWESAGGEARMDIGTPGLANGRLLIYGDNDDEGGHINLYTAANYDTDINIFTIKALEDDLWIGWTNQPDALKFTGNGAAVTASFSVGLTGTTIDASVLGLLERAADPTEPTEGTAVIWMSDGSGKGDDGDIMIASQAGGVTKYGTIFDHSGGGSW